MVQGTDESSYVIGRDADRECVLRKVNERYSKRYIQGTHKFGRGSVMIWRCLRIALVSPLANVDGTLDHDEQVNISARICTHGWKVRVKKTLA